MEEYILQLAAAVKKLKEEINNVSSNVSTVEKMEGPKGEQGPKGDKGEKGLDGKDGLPGKDGKDGRDGKDGIDGRDGDFIRSIELDFDNSIVVTLSDGREIKTEPLMFGGNSSSNTFISNTLGSRIDLLAVNTSIIPDTDVTYDLGSSTKRFRDLYLSSNSIYLGDTVISAKAGGGLNLDKNTSFDSFDAASTTTPSYVIVKQGTKWVKATMNQVIGWVNGGIVSNVLLTEDGNTLVAENGDRLIME